MSLKGTQLYFNLPEQNKEELEKQRIAKERAKERILADMREHKRIRQEYELAEQQEAQEKQKKEETKKVLEIINLRWEHTEKSVADQRPDFVVIGDTIKLLADVNNGDGNKSLFEVHDLNIPYSIDPEQLVVDKSSKVEASATNVEWKVSDPRSKKNAEREIDLYFLVKVKDTFSENCEIPVQEVTSSTWGECIGPDEVPIYNIPFVVLDQKNEIVHQGFSTEKGLLEVPFENDGTFKLSIISGE